MIDAVLFDVDGLLANTEDLHCRSYQATLASHGITLSSETYAAHWIRDGKGIADFAPTYAPGLDLGAVRAEKARRYHALVAAEAVPLPGARELLAGLRGRKRLAAASSSYRASVDAVLAALDITHFFESISSRESAPRAKPDPGIFLHAARALGVPPARCLVLEDSEKGVIAAHRAGMRCIAVPNEFTRENDFGLADGVVRSLADIDPLRFDAADGIRVLTSDSAAR